MVMPAGLGVSSDQSPPLPAGCEVSGAVACAWLDRWTEARDIGDAALEAHGRRRPRSGARDWAVLKEMAPEGDYPEVLWQIADDAARGKPTEWYEDGLGCQ